VPGFIRRLVVRPRPLYQRLRAANREYARRSGEIWKERFRQDVKRDVQAGMKPGHEIARRLRLPRTAERDAAALAARLGITADARIVTVHVRESGYRAAAQLRQRAWDTLRNARIETYAAAFDALVERGYTVVRLGDPTMTPVSRPGVIDLATAAERSEWLDVWCVQRSEFMIGCDSGPSWLAVLLNVPVLTVNSMHFRDVERLRDRVICKLARERSTGRVLRITEMLMPEYLRNGLDTERYEHLDNTPDDIRDAVLDMIEALRTDEKWSMPQRMFKRRLVEVAAELPHDWSGLQGIAVLGRPRGTLSRPFARKYL
jgi:putative glycosyltransferase (TIGR04372 family)